MKPYDPCPHCSADPLQLAPQKVLRSVHSGELTCPTCGTVFDENTGESIGNFKEDRNVPVPVVSEPHGSEK